MFPGGYNQEQPIVTAKVLRPYKVSGSREWFTASAYPIIMGIFEAQDGVMRTLAEVDDYQHGKGETEDTAAESWLEVQPQLLGYDWPRRIVTTEPRTDAEVVVQSKTDDWYTPPGIVDSARLVMGRIDLDPASCEEANHHVKAKRYFTKIDDGLVQDWTGNVWLNPPYGDMTEKFVSVLLDQYRRRITRQAVVLLSANATTTRYFQPLFEFPICFPMGRINFWGATEATSSSTHGSVFVYLGPKVVEFVAEFNRYGAVLNRLRPLMP